MPHLIVNTVDRQHPSFLMVRGAIGWSSNVSIADDCKLYNIHLAKHKHKHRHKHKHKHKHKQGYSAGFLIFPPWMDTWELLWRRGFHEHEWGLSEKMSLYPYLPTRHRELLPKVDLMCSIVVILSKFTPTNIYDVGCNGAIEGVEAYLKRVSSYLGSFGWLARLICIVCVKTHHSRVDVVLVFLWGIWKGISDYKRGGICCGLCLYYMQRMKPTLLICFLQYICVAHVYICVEENTMYICMYI